MKPSFTAVQKAFLEKFRFCLERDFKGEQNSMAARIGCDKSSISRWVNHETAPPDFVCHLLLKELGADTVPKALGRRIKFLREKVFRISMREFAWTFELENISQVEAIENGEIEPPRSCLEQLMGKYFIHPHFLDYGKNPIFAELSIGENAVASRLKDGFNLYIITAPKGNPDRRCLRCVFVLFREREAHLPELIRLSGTGTFNGVGVSHITLEMVIGELMEAAWPEPARAPMIFQTTEKIWKELRGSCFYAKGLIRTGEFRDEECAAKFKAMLPPMQESFNIGKEIELEKEAKKEPPNPFSRI